MRCDTHVHIVGPVARYPQVPERTYLAGEAPLDGLKRRGAPHGITRFVIVQPSFYGFDNSATLDALDELAGNGRGVAVIDPKTWKVTKKITFDIPGLRKEAIQPVGINITALNLSVRSPLR